MKFSIKNLFNNKARLIQIIFGAIFTVSALFSIHYLYRDYKDSKSLDAQNSELRLIKSKGMVNSSLNGENQDTNVSSNSDTSLAESTNDSSEATTTEIIDPHATLPPSILGEYQDLYDMNSDMIGWLKIEGTVIDYPVMQTLDDESYYLYHDFNGDNNVYGSLILDSDSVAGAGTLEYEYQNGSAPSTNLIIHGHTTSISINKMFGSLRNYADEEYGAEHNIIYFDTLYEHRKYELISVFKSRVYRVDDDVFKYYKFFEAYTEEDFDYWYTNIKEMSLYDTGVTATYGDEFITLSCCAYHTDNGRFVVVAKRIE